MKKSRYKRGFYILSRFISSIFVTLIFSVTILAVTVQGVTPDVVGPDGLPAGYVGFFSDTYWTGYLYIQSSNDAWQRIPTTWGLKTLFLEDVPITTAEYVNTFPLYATLDSYINVNFSAQLATDLYYQTTHLKFTFTQTYTIPAGQQMEFWVRVKSLSLSGYPQSYNGGTSTSGGQKSYTAPYFEYALDDRWYLGDKDTASYVVFDHYTDLKDNDWVCYRSDKSDIDRTISGIALVPPVGTWSYLYKASIWYNIDLSPVLVGDLDNYSNEPEVPTDDIVDRLDQIIDGSEDMDPDVNTPNYDDIQPNPDYDVGGLVGESDAIAGLDQMQQDVDLLIGSQNFLQASNFWQELFHRLFSIAGASVMSTVSGVIIVIRAVIGR